MGDKTDKISVEPMASVSGDIAIVGMAAQLPGAANVDVYWQNLRQGLSAIKPLNKDELEAAGESAERIADPNYVPFAARLEGFDEFDAEFFGFSPKDAAIMDPQHRKFLEVAWHALENAGHVPESFGGPIGAFGGCGMGSYFYFNICSNRDLVDDVGMFLLRHTGNDKDFLTTRLSHAFDLKGPSLGVQTACSTSLVATHLACQALISGECDMALAGGVTIELPHGRGYLYADGEILSPDGQCHAFDHRAKGTVFGSGAGMVVLRRLEDAVADGDHIWAVIKGSAINNDGSDKAGYLAPSVTGQSDAIAEAIVLSGVEADQIGYVECHGTGTYLGDPIEVAALTSAFRESTDAKATCRIGSVKTNIGHLDTAAGAAGLIKSALALHHREIPPSLGFEAPNPAIDFENSPFVVNAALTEWSGDKPRYAGVNSLGVGGTNAHVILGEAPERSPSEASDWPFQPLVLSGHSKEALAANANGLADYLEQAKAVDLADVAFTLKEGRKAFSHRQVLVAHDRDEAVHLLRNNDPARVFNHRAVGDMPRLCFLFSGGGAQYADMARDLYETEPLFRDVADEGLEILKEKSGLDYRQFWFSDANKDQEAALKRPSVQLPLLTIVEVAMTRLLESWGVVPDMALGHSMGENAAACIAGVMSFSDCLGLVLLRGQLFEEVEEGGMMSVPLGADDIRELLGDSIDIAAENAADLSVLSGSRKTLDKAAKLLLKQGFETQVVPINIAAHSRLLDPILERFQAYLEGITLSAPTLPFLSNRTGDFITDQEAQDPAYWVAHLRNTVRFSSCAERLASQDDVVFVEVGPGKVLGSLLALSPGIDRNRVINTLRHVADEQDDDIAYFGALLRLWALGGNFDWTAIWGDKRRLRLPLPGYAFQRTRYFIEPAKTTEAASELRRHAMVEDFATVPVWKAQYADCLVDVSTLEDMDEVKTWLVLKDQLGLAEATIARLRAGGQTVVEVETGDVFQRQGRESFTLAPEQGLPGYQSLMHDLVADGLSPDHILSFWTLSQSGEFRAGSSSFHRNQEQGFYALLFLTQAIDSEKLQMPLRITCVGNNVLATGKRGDLEPDKATLLGAVGVIPREMPGISISYCDLALPQEGRKRRRDLTPEVSYLLEEALAETHGGISAFVDGRRMVQAQRSLAVKSLQASAKLRARGVYAITGGFSDVGLVIAAHLARAYNARLALISRRELPDRADWARYLRLSAAGDPMAAKILAVQRLEEAGATVVTATADVCNPMDMARAKTGIEAAFGPINGVIHAAGVLADGPALVKTQPEIEDVLAPKVQGTLILDEVFGDGALDWMVLFSSTSATTCPAGQVDYAAANAFLNAYAQSRAADETKVIALNWGIWSEVGLAARAIAPKAKQENLSGQPVNQPLLQQMATDSDGHRAFLARLGQKDWLFDEHKLSDGQAILPGTGYLELLHEAWKAQGETRKMDLRDVYFLAPMALGDSGAVDIQVRLKRSAEGYEATVFSTHPDGGRPEIHLEAQLYPFDGGGKTIDLAVIAERMGDVMQADGSPLKAAQDGQVLFGPRWQLLSQTSLGTDEGLAKLELALEYRADIRDGMGLHPAVMDIATGWAMELIKGYSGATLWMPLGYQSIQVHAPLGAEVQSWARLVKSSAENATFDVTITDPAGQVLVEVRGFTMRRLSHALPAAPLVRPGPVAGVSEGPAQKRLRRMVALGITPDEGVAAFLAALEAQKPVVTMSSIWIEDLLAEAERGETASQNPLGFERPKLTSDFVAPEGPVETALVGFWKDLLGVTEIGVEDNFFDLGGHSLIAVRLFSTIRKTWGADFSMSVLFEAPTIRACAQLIVKVIGDVDAPEDNPVALKDSRRFKHLVAMHNGEGGPKRPFFLVAGMFGNVLNLRHLAHLVGADRPFYGLQARGLLGDDAPHDSIVKAAKDYIAEMREIQPHGPYLIGGFSGGGITAYEIARQLEEAGEGVAQLIMLDTPLPMRRPLSSRDRLLIQMQEMRSKGVVYPAVWLKSRVLWEVSRRFGNAPVETHSGFHNAEIEAAFLKAVAAYQPQPWDGAMTLFRPPLIGKWQVGEGRMVSSERAYLLSDNDWRQFVPGMIVQEVPGDHDSMVLEPNVRVLADRIRRLLETAEATWTARHGLDETHYLEAAE